MPSHSVPRFPPAPPNPWHTDWGPRANLAMSPIAFPGDEVDLFRVFFCSQTGMGASLRARGGMKGLPRQGLPASRPAPPNAFFEQFPNVYTFAGAREFRSQLQRALAEDPRPLGEEHRRILSWARGAGRNEDGGTEF